MENGRETAIPTAREDSQGLNLRVPDVEDSTVCSFQAKYTIRSHPRNAVTFSILIQKNYLTCLQISFIISPI